jgi:hypothetical protein
MLLVTVTCGNTSTRRGRTSVIARATRARLAEDFVKNRQADIHPIVDVGVVVVELLVGVADAGGGEAGGEEAGAVVAVVLVAPAAVDVDAAQGFQGGAVSGDEVDRVVPAPGATALLD